VPLSDWPNDGGLSARHIRRACEDSLRRLQTDYIDLYQMHHVDRNTPWEEIWEAMELLRLQGKILYVGSSNFAGWHLAVAQEAARARHFLGLVSEQSIYNLMVRDIEMEVIPAAQYQGIGVLAWSPLYRGLLTGVLRQENAASRYTPEHLETHRAQLERFEALCDEVGEAPAEVALAWHRTGHRPAQRRGSRQRGTRSRDPPLRGCPQPTGRDLPRSEDRARAVRLVSAGLPSLVPELRAAVRRAW
jgi:NDP-hexose 2,3-enoyl reductase